MMYDVLVVGAGHAGCEAALAAARLGAKTALVTLRADRVGRMSCNPSVGGMAKSHIVHELDALGGVMGENADFCGLHFRTLNTKKGPAVQATRAQCDKEWYARRMHWLLRGCRGLDLLEGMVEDLQALGRDGWAVRAGDGRSWKARTVVLTAGSFLRGRIYIGKRGVPGGRMDEPSCDSLGERVESLGHRRGRLKTGTPPRLHRDSLDYSGMILQPGLVPPPFFSRAARRAREWFHVEQQSQESHEHSGMFHVEHESMPWPPGEGMLPCFLTHTTQETHALIGEHLAESALYGGSIEGTGVRYCPSIEDKVVKFSGRSSHHVFVEPEGRDNPRIYPNGISNSLPADIQLRMVHSIPGFEQAEMIRPGYAIEYDFFDPTQLSHSLESKVAEGLFFAGQVNGTTGYEEAAGQGFIAGVNAALKVRGEPALTLDRTEAYIGVLIDDLVTKGTDEPYRMFTSRAEFRLSLRQDNAAYRMLPHAARLGLLPRPVLEETRDRKSQMEAAMTRLQSIAHEHFIDSSFLLGMYPEWTGEMIGQVLTELKYAGYIAIERRQIERLRLADAQRIPPDFPYLDQDALRFESREKLARIRPESLGQAARIPGVTPADIAVLSVLVTRNAGMDGS